MYLKAIQYFFLGIAFISFTACGGDSTGEKPTDTTSLNDSESIIQTADFSGAWFGSWGQDFPVDDPEADGTDTDLTFTAFIQQEGNNIYGILTDQAWMVEVDIIGSVEGNTIQFRLNDGEEDEDLQMVFSGALVDNELTGTISGPPIGDGHWQGYRIQEGKLSVSRSIPTGGGRNFAYDGEYFWLRDIGIEKMNAQGEVIRRIGEFEHLDYGGPHTFGNGTLWGTANYGTWIVSIDLEDGSILDTIVPEISPEDSPLGIGIDDMAHDEVFLWLLAGDSIFKMNGEQVMERFLQPTRADSMAFDGEYFWVYCRDYSMDYSRQVRYIYKMNSEGKVLSVYRNLLEALNINPEQLYSAGIAADENYLYITAGTNIEVLNYR